MQNSGNTILITGGTGGLGHRFAQEFAKRGNTLIITGRDRKSVDAFVAGNPGMAGYVLDVQDADAIKAFAAQVAAEHPDLNVLFNMAGIMVAEDLTAQDLTAQDLSVAEATVTTNLLGPIRLTSALLPHLLAKDAAAVINVSSGLAFVPLAKTPTYCATKAGIHSYSVSLREQLKDSKVEVIELVPPGVQTDLMPGQADDPQMMPLEDYIRDAMALFDQQPTPKEVAVERVNFLYKATAEGRFDETFETLNGTHR